MYDNNSFSKKTNKLFFNYRGRISRKAFILSYLSLVVFTLFYYSIFYKICGRFFPVIVTNLMIVICAILITYSIFILGIKRLRDLNRSAWWSLIFLFPSLNLLFVIYLAVAKGKWNQKSSDEPLDDQDDKETLESMEPYKRLLNETKNDSLEGEDISEVKKTSSLLSTKNGLIALGILVVLIGISKWKEKYRVTNDSEGIKKIETVLKIMPESVRKEVMKNKRSMGGVFVDDQFITVGGPITKDRILIRGIQFSNMVRTALSQNKKIQIRFLDNSLANITKLIASNNALSVQMAVFEIDQAIGTPGYLGDKNKKLLQQMNAF